MNKMIFILILLIPFNALSALTKLTCQNKYSPKKFDLSIMTAEKRVQDSRENVAKNPNKLNLKKILERDEEELDTIIKNREKCNSTNTQFYMNKTYYFVLEKAISGKTKIRETIKYCYGNVDVRDRVIYFNEIDIWFQDEVLLKANYEHDLLNEKFKFIFFGW